MVQRKLETSCGPDRDGNSIEWELTRAFCNRVPRWGMEREAEQIVEWRRKCRAYRYKRAKRLMMDEAQKNG